MNIRINLSSREKEESSSSSLWDWTSPKEDLFNPDVEYGTLVDARDGHEYKTVVIGEGDKVQEWMAENLNYAVDSSKCYMEVPHYCDKVGRYYTWLQAIDTACPEGWHIPSSNEWNTMRQNLWGNPDVRLAGVVYPDEIKTKLKTALYWERDSVPNLNSTGFSVFPAGYWKTTDAYNEFVAFGYSAVFWMAKMETWSVESIIIGWDANADHIRTGLREKTDFASVRCVRNRAQIVGTD